MSAAEVVRDARQVARLVRKKVALRLQQWDHKLRRALWLAAALAMVALTFVVATITAVVLLLRGAAAGIAEWTGHAWIGDLAIGALFLGGLATCFVAIGAARRRAKLRQLRQRLGG